MTVRDFEGELEDDALDGRIAVLSGLEPPRLRQRRYIGIPGTGRRPLYECAPGGLGKKLLPFPVTPSEVQRTVQASIWDMLWASIRKKLGL
jgi:hypothetical protein